MKVGSSDEDMCDGFSPLNSFPLITKNNTQLSEGVLKLAIWE